MDRRNGYMLSGRLARRGYDWWWHSLVGVDKATGERQPFFIEYYVVNPALGGPSPVPGQLPGNRERGVRPSYAMIKAGRWGAGRKAQLHNLYPVSEFAASREGMEVRIGGNVATETLLKGSVSLSAAEAAAHPEYMSDAGEMSWELEAEKVLPYSVGWGTSPLSLAVDAFQMYWHAAGMLTRYKGRVTFDGKEYLVEPESSAGYQDKNWGRDYTSPWIWLNCNNLTSRKTGKRLARTSLDLGGAQPVAFGVSLPRRLLVAFYHEGELYEWNFSKFWKGSRQRFDCPVLADMLNVNYENPDGEKLHNSLWNGGHASGTVKLWRKERGARAEVDTIDGELGGCECGECDR